MKKQIFTYLFILLGSLLYGLGTVLFVFPNEIVFGGTSGIAVILSRFIPLTAGQISVIANVTLLLVAFVVLGKGMAIKTLVGSLLTTVFIGAFEKLLYRGEPFIENNYVAAILGALIIAIASGVMFYVDSSSGGTDIIALIIKQYVKLNEGRALLISDIVIVIGGGILGGLGIAIPSLIGFIIKVFGIDIVIRMISLYMIKKRV